MKTDNSNEVLEILREYELNFSKLIYDENSISIEESIRDASKVIEYLKLLKTNTLFQIESFLVVIDCLTYSLSKAVEEKNLNYIKYEGISMLQSLQCKIYKLINNINIDTGLDEETRKDFFENVAPIYGLNHFTAASEDRGEFKYEVSILVVGYNKVEYTKKCVESVLKYPPKNVSYELVLFNHGSTDSTIEYFNSIPNARVIDIHKNGPGFEIMFNVLEGKYVFVISNDVLVTENAFENMYKCIKSDENISLVVPLTTNTANKQSLKDNFQDEKQIFEFASNFNISNSLLWEEKAKLFIPLGIMNMSDFVGRDGVFYSSKNIGFYRSFCDDFESYLFREKGKKLILMNDTFCYHFGSVTVHEEITNTIRNEGITNGEEYYLKERSKYYKFLNYDPSLCCSEESPELYYYLNFNKIDSTSVLGIGSGLGANLYKIKYKIKSYTGNENTSLCCINDVRGIDKIVEKCYDEYLNVTDCFDSSIIDNFYDGGREFDVILIEDIMPRDINLKKYFDSLFSILKNDGVIAIRKYGEIFDVKLLALYPWAEIKTNWIILRHENIKAQKIFIPCIMYDWENNFSSKIENVFDALLSQQFDITVKVHDDNLQAMLHGCDFILGNNSSFYDYIATNSEVSSYFRVKENLIVVDEYNYNDVINLRKDIIDFLNIKFIAANKKIEIELESNKLKVINVLEYNDNVEQTIYNEFLTYFISLEEGLAKYKKD